MQEREQINGGSIEQVVRKRSPESRMEAVQALCDRAVHGEGAK